MTAIIGNQELPTVSEDLVYLWLEKIGLSNLRRPGCYPPPLNATTIQPLGTGSVSTPRSRGSCPDLRWAWLESHVISLRNIGVGKAEMTLMRRRGEDAANPP